MQKVLNKRIVFISLLIAISMLIMSVPTFAAATGTHTPVTGVTVGVSGATDNSMTDGAVTVTAKGSAGIFGFGASAKTATITITNDSGSKANVSFSVAKTTVNSFTANAGTLTDTSFTMTMDAGAVVTLTLTTAQDATENKVVLSDFKCVAVSDNATATVTFDSAKGSVSLAGSAVNSGDTATAAGGQLAAVATPASGCSFVAWVNADTNEILSKVANTTLNVPQSVNVKAVFIKGTTDNAYFQVGNCLYDDLPTAVTKGSTVVLANNGALPAGNYTIPSGVTLLIPCDAANTLYTTAPGNAGGDTYTTPTIFSTLTITDGTCLTVDGAISIGGQIGTAMGNSQNGAPSGPLGRIEMASGSNITVNSGANLYAWGYITGSGSVEIKSGGTVYEDFQIRDWRGGSVTSAMLEKTQKVFPLSQFYIQNIEVPMTLNAGATEVVSTAMTITLAGVQNPCPEFIGSNGLFVISDGYIIKDYDESTGRTIVTTRGDVSLSNLSITLKVSALGSKTINSQDYVLPIPGHFTFNVESGDITTAQDIAFLPGSEVNISAGANWVMGSGYSMYVYDADDWGKYCYYQTNSADATYAPLLWAPNGVKDQSAFVTRDAKILVNGSLDASAGGLYTTAGGANICTDGTGTILVGSNTATETYQYSQIADDDGHAAETYVSIPVTSAQLNNGGDDYVSTTNGTYSNCTTHGWFQGETCPNCHEHTYDAGVVTTPATCTVKGAMTYSCTVSGCTHSYTEEIAALGHNMVAGQVTAPTCTAGGYTTYTCENGCGTTEQRDQTSATGHLHTTTTTVDATCTEAGSVTVTCDDCGETISSETVAAKGHTHAAAVEENRKEATCGAAGSYDSVVYCSVCGTEVSRETKSIAATGNHNYNSVVTAPTCEAEGYTTHTCTACGDTYKDAETASIGHSYTESVTKAATCTEAGEKTYTCSACGDSYTETVAATGHKNTTTTTVDATCTASGSVTVTCDDCGETISSETVAAKGHIHAAAVEENRKEATCGAAGSYDSVVYCSVCGAEVNRETKSIAATGNHTYNSVVTAPTCEAEGYTTHTCTACGDTYKDAETAATGHSYEEWTVIKSATCMTKGEEHRGCKNCDHFETQEIAIDANAHTGNNHTENVKNATCSEEGYTGDTVCECGVTVATGTTTSKLAHTEITIPGKEATCTETGLTDGVKCSVCGEIITAQEEIPMVDHTPGEAVIENENNATCTQKGSYEEVVYCTVCKTHVISRTTIETDMIDHSFSNYVAHVNRDGYETAKCDNCDATDTRLKNGFIAGGQCGDSLYWELNEDGTMYISGEGEMYDYSMYYSNSAPWLSNGWMIKTVFIEEGATSIGDYAFYYDCGILKTFVMADSVTNIGTYAFYFCSEMTELTISNGLEVVEEGAFSDCYGLKELTLSETVNSIGAYAFQNCQNLTKITFVGDAPAFNAAAFGYASSITVYYPCDNETWTNDVLQNYGGTVTWMANHVEVIDEAVDPTCIETGKTEGKHCSICDEVLVAQAVVAATGHKNVTTTTVDATCTEAGFVTVTCDDCGATVSTETIEAMGHSYVDGVCDNCGEEVPVEEKAYDFGQTSQIYLVEPWALRAKLNVYHYEGGTRGAKYTAEELANLLDYGIYFLRASDRVDDSVEITAEEILNSALTTKYSKDDPTRKAYIDSGNSIYADYLEGVYTYQFSDSIYVLCYITDENGTHFAGVRERNLKDMVNKEKTRTDIDQKYVDIYTAMSKLEEDFSEYIAGYEGEPPALQKAPTLVEYPIAYTGSTATFSHTWTLSLVEPWGIQLTGYIDGSTDYLEYGALVFYDVNQLVSDPSTLTVEQLMTEYASHTYVFSSANGDVMLSKDAKGRHQIVAMYNKGVYTYQMDSNAYVVFFVKDANGYHFGPMKVRNIMENMDNFIGIAGDKQKVILEDIRTMHEAAKKLAN